MQLAKNSTLMSTVIATVAATCAWSFGLCDKMWPTHPFMADLLLSLVIVIVVKEIWKREFSR
ncbi:MAG: hypothetical protein ACRD3P_10730 [Terriglobales bacterium]